MSSTHPTRARWLLSALLGFCAASCRAPEPTAPSNASETAGAARSDATHPKGKPEVALPIDKTLTRPDPLAHSRPLPGFTRGVNLGNGLDAPSEGAWGTVLSNEHFSLARSSGFDHVRLPVRFSTPERSEPQAPYRIKEAFFQRVDWAVDQALANGLSVIVDVHHFEEIHKQPGENKARLYAFWEQIATRYSTRPPAVAFEILNEPNGALMPDLINEITAEALRIIRQSNPTRLVFADPYFWASAQHLEKLALPADDDNVVAEFHLYEPILFTHQRASWMDPWWGTRGVIFPGPPQSPIVPVPATEGQQWVKDWFRDYNTLPLAENPGGPRRVFDYFDHAARYVKATGKRVYLGEFGAIDVADAQSRENYVWLVRTEAERRGIGWAYWDDGGAFKLMDPPAGKLNAGLARALFEP